MDYKQAYLMLFNSVTDLINELQMIQQEAESIVIEETPNETEIKKAALLSKTDRN